MASELHDLGALEALADAGGTAADWANVRLALRAPARVRGLPSESWDAAICLATGARGSVDGLLERLRRGRRDPTGAELAEGLATFGLLPADPAPWIEAARSALRGDGRDTDVLLASLLAELGELDRDTLGAAVKGASDRLWYLLPGLVLRFAERHEPERVREVAAEVAASLARQEQGRPGLVGLALARLGVPVIAVEDPDPELAVGLGARVASAPTPALRATRGSARRRSRRVAQDLLEGVAGPAAALIRALARVEEGPDPFELAAAAAWVAVHEPTTPVEDVALRGAGEDPAVLTRARRAVGPADAEVLTEAMGRDHLRLLPAAALAAPLLAAGVEAPSLLAATAERCLRLHPADPRSAVAGCVALARSPRRVVELLTDPSTRLLGFTYARFAPFEEVLSALLDAPVPAEPEHRELLGQALGDQGERAALERLEGMIAAFPDDPRLARTGARARALLGVD